MKQFVWDQRFRQAIGSTACFVTDMPVLQVVREDVCELIEKFFG
jgi:hypothetical protein